jgi:thiamine-monophosphate kinase
MSLGEFDIIARYFTRRSARADVLLGIGDDAAVIASPANRRLVVAIDTIVEGVHFPVGTDAADIGYRAVAVNLSDLAAMGAQPSWMTLSLSLPHADERWLEGFASGLFELADAHDVALIGGDTVRGPLVATVQIAGLVEPDTWLTRSAAKPGDVLFVSGVPGEAAAGLAVLQDGSSDSEAAQHLVRRFRRPEPRVALGRTLRTLASAAMDVSDGLLTDLEKMCAASGCGARVDVDALPHSTAMRQLYSADAALKYALSGGDDYELLFTVAPNRVGELFARIGPMQVAQIGTITADDAVQCVRNGVPLALPGRGYDHFAKD